MRHFPTRHPGRLSVRFASLAALAAGLVLAACAGENEDEVGGSGGTPSSGGGGAGGTPIVVAGGGGAGGGIGGQGGTGGAPVGGAGGGSGGEGGEGGTPPNNCGNGVLDEGEQCEGADFGGKTCATFGLSGGTLQCNPFCGIVVSACTPLEQCFDGFDNDDALVRPGGGLLRSSQSGRRARMA